jgi:porphobilinogen synthase
MKLSLIERPRRLRKGAAMRDLVRETRLHPKQLMQPLFVHEGKDVEPIGSLTGISRWPVDKVGQEAERLAKLGLGGVLIFGIPAEKDERGTQADADDGVAQRAVRAIRKAVGKELVITTDVCLCEYTSHGHCGILHEGDVLNDETVERLVEVALSHAEAGADIVAPSDMMDGRVGAIREGLDDAGFETTALMSYAVKYASAFYGPFRDAAQSTPASGDRKGAQMDPANLREALREAELDVQEGADIIMVKPGMPYLDVIHALRQRFDVPIAAYHVSGEYAMVKAAGQKGWIDEKAVMLESLQSFVRAGAGIIITYAGADAAGWLRS